MKKNVVHAALCVACLAFFSTHSNAQEATPYIVRLVMPYQNLSGNYLLQLVMLEGKLYDVSGRNYRLTLNDADGSFSGQICNSFRGQFQSTMGKTISFGPFMSTKKICVAVADEDAIFNAFQQATDFQLQEDTLVLLSNGAVVLKLQRKSSPNDAPAEKTVNDANGCIDRPLRIVPVLHN